MAASQTSEVKTSEKQVLKAVLQFLKKKNLKVILPVFTLICYCIKGDLIMLVFLSFLIFSDMTLQ